MIINYADLSPQEIYHSMIQAIVPRPIAWVLSNNDDDSLNLAPFSFFSGVCNQPPILSLSITSKRNGEPKDTYRNINERDVFTVHIPSVEQAKLVTDSAENLEYRQSEIDLLGLTTTPFGNFQRLENCQVAMLCKRHEIITIGTAKQRLVLGEILQVYINDEILTTEQSIDQLKLNPLARLSGQSYGQVNPLKSKSTS